MRERGRKRGKGSLEKIVRRNRWRKMKEGIEEGNRRTNSREGSAGEIARRIAVGKRWIKSQEGSDGENAGEGNRGRKSLAGSQGESREKRDGENCLRESQEGRNSQEIIAGESCGRESQEENSGRNTREEIAGGIARNNRWRKLWEGSAGGKPLDEIAGRKRLRNRKKNRGWEALDKIARRKWRQSQETIVRRNRGRKSWVGSAGENRKKEELERVARGRDRGRKSREEFAGGTRWRKSNRKKNHAREALEKIARRKC